jgi:serine/threonine protein kinase/tetratricopeptide (TPR) repeat protein
MIGSVVAQYRIVEKLGVGGMGVVYKAEDLNLKRIVALKFLPPEIHARESERARFLQEARAAAGLNHPNLCTIYDMAEVEGQQFIVMEFVDGRTLRDLAPIRDLNATLNYALQIAEGLQEAHAHGIIHRDVKSENIMVTTKDRVKVMDFGLAKLKGSLRLTRLSGTVGTVAYMSPEQLQGQEADARSDIFSFGIVLYEMLSGRLPFFGEHEAAVIYAIVNQDPEPISQTVPDLPSGLQVVLEKALRKNPAERYQSMQEVINDLRPIAARSSSAPTPMSIQAGFGREVSAPSTLVQFRARIIIVAVALITVLAIGTILFLRRSGGPDIEGDHSIAVMYFENRSGQKDLDRLLVEMLITNLGRNRRISVISGQRLFDILKSIGKQDSSVIDRSTATEVAKRAGANTMLLGSIWKVGGRFSISTQLLDVESGRVINSDRCDIDTEEEIFTIADRFTGEVGQWLLGQQVDTLHVAEAGSSSLAAYQKYSNGLQHIYRFEHNEALASFSEAVRLDTSFAMAHLMVSMEEGRFVLGSPYPGYPLMDRAREAALAAERHAAHLPERDRLLIRGWFQLITRNTDSARVILADLSQRFPEDKEACFWLAFLELGNGDFRDAAQWEERAIAIDPSFADALNILSYIYCLTREFDKALEVNRTYTNLIPDAWNGYDSGWEILTWAGRHDEAFKVTQEGLRRNPRLTTLYDRQAQTYLLTEHPDRARERWELQASLDPEEAETIRRAEVISFFSEGRIAKMIELLNNSIAEYHSNGRSGAECTVHLALARVLADCGKTDRALTEIESARTSARRLPERLSLSFRVRSEYYAGRILVRSGNGDEARRRADTLWSMIHLAGVDPFYLLTWHGLMAEILLADGKYQDARDALHRVDPYHLTAFPRFRIVEAKIAAALGDEGKALRILEETRNSIFFFNGGMGGDYWDFWMEQSKLDFYTAEVYARFGDNEKARMYYEKTLQYWKNADRDFLPKQEALRRLGKMTAVN